MTDKRPYVKPIPHFVQEQGTGMYYEIDIDFWLSALWRQLNQYFRHQDADMDEDSINRYPLLYAFWANHNSRFVDNYEKSLREKNDRDDN